MTIWTCDKCNQHYDYLEGGTLRRCPECSEATTCPLCGRYSTGGLAHGDCIDQEALRYDLAHAMPYDAMDQDNRDLYWRARAAQEVAE